MTYIIIASLLVLPIFNRLRGTGALHTPFLFDLDISYLAPKINYIFQLSGNKYLDKIRLFFNTPNTVIPDIVPLSLALTGALLTALYLGFITILLSSLSYGVAVFVIYLIGESFGWGKWIGSLCEPDSIPLEKRYLDLEGYRFPYIHKLANTFVKEKENYTAYCNVALGLRGFYWWVGVFFTLSVAGVTEYSLGLLIAVVLGASFPLACYLSTITNFEFGFWRVNCYSAWERQEVIYGLFQSAAFIVALTV